MGKAMKTLSPPVEVAPMRKATLLECLLAAAASGALLAFALPPFDVPLLGFVALAPMMAAVLRASAIPALVSTLLTGIVAGTVMTAFLSGVGDGYMLLCLLLAVGIGYTRSRRERTLP
jgi:apolipoprotein N-acyltransferase